MKEFRTKEQELRYYGSDLNKFVASDCRKDMVVMNIDLIINDYKKGKLRIIESKHANEKMGKGQYLTLKELSKKGIDCYTIYGNEPYDLVEVYSFQADRSKLMNNEQLKQFLNNE